MSEQLLNLLVTVLTPILLAVGTWLAGEAIRLIRARVRNEQIGAALERAVHVIEVGAGEVTQEFVSGLKAKGGKLSAEDAAYARDLAIKKAKEHLGPRGVKELQYVLGEGSEESLDRYLVGLLESHISVVNRGFK